MNTFLKKASFTEICKELKKDKHREKWQCVLDLFGTALLFFPGLMCKEVASLTNICKSLGDGLNLVGAAEQVRKATGSVLAVFKNKETDFSVRYDQMQTAHTLLVYAAYFDSMALYLPDVTGQIALSEKEKHLLTQEAVRKYCVQLQEHADGSAGEILQKELLPPDPVVGLEQYEEELELFYTLLNREFAEFFGKLSALEEMDAHEKDRVASVLIGLPKRAVQNYWKQYYELAAIFPEFCVWVNQQEHQRMERCIDVGFAQMQELLEHYEERNAERKTVNAFEKCLRIYQNYVGQAVIRQEELVWDGVEQIVFPEKKEIFIPQSFRVLNYENEYHLEKEETWGSPNDQEEIAAFIRGKLLHPSMGQAPLVILGHPGAGKTLLCHMLAARSLCGEFHTLIIRLRDVDAEQTIMQQINGQMERDLGGGCSWNDIVNANLSRPLLFIFDGYDELLQASGRTYAGYLSRIAEFQQQQSQIHGIMIRCIVTSRISLIDKAVIPKGSTILRLNEFDDARIELWCSIWNRGNTEYFARHGYAPFKLEKKSSVYTLARQPLLLLMLALYDSENNALKHRKDMSLTQLYENLIEEFVIREKRKDRLFLDCEESQREAQLTLELSRISVAAFGMYNRRALFIRSEDLNRDLCFYEKEKYVIPGKNGNSLSDSEALLGSFFFIHKSEAEAGRLQAYEFLHNTFGEFLTARFLLEQMYEALCMKQDAAEKQKLWADRFQVSIMYAPLFARPLVLSMVGGYYRSFFEQRGILQEQLEESLEILIEKELPGILSGEKLIELKQLSVNAGNPYQPLPLMEHLAIYSINLLLLRTVLGECRYELDITRFNQPDLWERMTCIWKYAFSQEDFLRLGELFGAWKTEKGYMMQYMPMPQRSASWSYYDTEDQLSNLFLISGTLGDSSMMALTGTLLGDAEQYSRVSAAIQMSGLKLNRQHMWNAYLNQIRDVNMLDEEKIGLLAELGKQCRVKDNLRAAYQYYLFLCALAEQDILPCTGRERDVFLENEITEGLGFLKQEGWILIGGEEQDLAVQGLLFRLMDYCTISETLFHQMVRSAIRRGTIHGKIAFRLKRRFMLNFLRKASQLSSQAKYRRYVKTIDREEVSELVRHVWGSREYIHEYLPDALVLCGQMIRYGDREYGLMLMAELLRPLSYEKNMYIRMGRISRMKVSDSLALLGKYGELPAGEIIYLRKNFVGQLSVKELLEVSQESLKNYCCLLNLEEKPEVTAAFISELKRLLQRKREGLMTGLVKEMERLLQEKI